MLTNEVGRKSLHKFADWLPEEEWESVYWTLLACLKRHDSFWWKRMTLPEDDEELTEEDILAIEEAMEDFREGRLFTWDEVKERLMAP